MFPYSLEIERAIKSDGFTHELVHILFDRYCGLPECEKESFVLALIGQIALISRSHQLP